LAKIEALELISRLYSRILIPPAVWQEVVEESEGPPGAVEMQRAVAAGWMVKQAAENKALVIALRQTLDNGEAEALLQPNCNQKWCCWTTNWPTNGAAAWCTSHWYFRSAAAG
jgi:predicted nucleic acid-binding protein